MAKYTSKPVSVDKPVEEVFEGFSDFTRFRQKIDELPEEAKRQLGDVKFEADSISFSSSQTGEIKLKATKRQAPGRIEFEAEGSPIPLKMEISLEKKGENSTEITTVVDVEIPMLLRPLIGNKMQQAADELAVFVARMNDI